MHLFLFLWLCLHPAVSHCYLWANPVLHPTTHPALGIPQYPHCYANLP